MAYDPTKPISPTNNPESISGDIATTPTGAKVNTTTGALIAPPPSTGTITSDLLAPIPAPVVSPAPVTSSISVANLPEITTAATTPATAISDVEGLLGQLEDRDVQKEAGVQTAEQQRALNELNKQIRLHQARSLEAEQKALKLGQTTGFARGEAERVRESNAVRALELSAYAQAAQGDLSLASQLATDAVNEKYKKVEADLRKKRNDIIANYENLSSADKKRADATLLRIDSDDNFVKQKKANETELNKLGAERASNGAPLNLVQKALATGDIIQATAMLAPYKKKETTITEIGGRKVLVNEQTGEVIKDLGATKEGIDTPTIPIEGAPAEFNNRQVITNFLKGEKVGQGTKTKLSAALGVINAVEDLATIRQTTKFQGVSPLNTLFDVRIPFTDIGLVPFRESLRSKEGRENTGYIEAINLKVQQWASGAALTKAQTEQVNKLTPKTTDTDSAVRTKLNNLENFMLTQIQGDLQSEGIAFTPERTNLFELYELIQKATPEQLQELKNQGLIK